MARKDDSTKRIKILNRSSHLKVDRITAKPMALIQIGVLNSVIDLDPTNCVGVLRPRISEQILVRLKRSTASRELSIELDVLNCELIARVFVSPILHSNFGKYNSSSELFLFSHVLENPLRFRAPPHLKSKVACRFH